MAGGRARTAAGIDASPHATHIAAPFNRPAQHMRLAVFRRRCILVVAAFAVAACAPPGAAVQTPDPATRGALLIVGGGPRPPVLRQRFVELAGGAGHANIVVFAMASEDAAANGAGEAEELRKLGADAQSLYLTREEADADSSVVRLSKATGVWFGGGDQSRLMAVLQGTRTEAMLHERFRAGAAMGGTSAGAAVMTRVMLVGEERRRGGSRYPSDSSLVNITIDRDNVVVREGFGFLESAIVDQHFLRRRRHNRLISIVLEQPQLIGVGIDESTALVVDRQGRWSVIGESSAVIYDARSASVTPKGAPVLGAGGLKMHVLPPGSSFDPGTGEVRLP